MSHASLASLYPAHLQILQTHATEALQRGGLDHLVVPSGNLHYQLFDDRDYPYAVNPQFKAWLPVTRAPGSWLLFTPGQKPTLLFMQPHDYWHVVPEAPSGYWVDHFDIKIIRTAEDAAALLPKDPARCAILGEPQSTLGEFVPNNPAPVVAYLEYHRAFKTPYEIAMMREATKIGVRAHRTAERLFRAGSSEFGIHLAYCQAAGQDANDLPYTNIVALNDHAAVLHYMRRDRLPPKPVRSFLIDAMDAAQLKMCAQVRAGFDYKQIHLDAHLAIATILKDFGLINVSPEVAVETGVSSAFFPHGVGHGIGLQVHEVAGFAESDRGGVIEKPKGHPYLRLTRVLEPGMVVTIEPGLYFIDMLLDELKDRGLGPSVDWDRVAQFKPYGGIRIEDDVACTDGDPENLTRDGFAAT